MAELLDISIAKARPPALKAPRIAEWRTVKTLPCGLSEQVGPRGRRRRVRLIRCIECEAAKGETEFSYRSDAGSGHETGICLECWISIVRRQKAQERIKLFSAILDQPQNYGSAERRAAIVRFASPAWRDREAIAAIYAEARRLTAETGHPHDVDHYYPLQSKLCCGLHVPANLRVVKASTNRSKSNQFPIDASPAWDGCEPWQISDLVRQMIEGLD